MRISSRHVLVAATVTLLGAQALPSSALEGTGINVTHVANLKHKVKGTSGNLSTATAQNGTDIEFASLDVTGLPGAPAGVTGVREFALAGTYNNGLQIIDITNPTTPVTAAVYDCKVSQGDVQVFTRAGRTYITYTQDNGYTPVVTSACYKDAKTLGLYTTEANGTFIADITNPYQPKTVSFVAAPRGSHNQTVAPGGDYLYNSNSDIVGLDGTSQASIEVFNIKNFAQPTKVVDLALVTGADSHDITFSADGKRAYTAALTHTLVLDTTDLAAPKIIGRIVDPSINIHHQSDPVTLKDKTTGQTRTFLLVTDEIAGAAGNAVCPGGGVHIFDITGPLEAAPVKVGFWTMPETRVASGNLTCTAHVLRIHPEQALMTIAWYEAGVRVVDLSSLIGVSTGVTPATGNVGAGLKEVGHYQFDNSDTWSVKTNKINADRSFFMFGNDMARGLDVYKFNGFAPAPSAESKTFGTWLTPAQALARAQSMGVAAAAAAKAPSCLLQGRFA